MRGWIAVVALAIGCGGGERRAAAPAAAADRNALAMRANVGWFWTEDGGAVPLAFYPPMTLAEAEARLAAAPARPADDREAKVWRDLAAGRPTLVRTHAAPGERAFLARMLEVAEAIDALYLAQTGAAALADRVAPDAASQSLFRRNHGARCASPALVDDPACTAIVAGAEPPALDCDALDEALMDPFTAVRGTAAVPYAQAWPDEMAGIADGLDRAADALDGPGEAAQVAYLRAAASAFRTNDWFAADLAWSAAGPSASAWYVRVGPDEVAWDPCGRKAGFHLTLARMDAGAAAWRDRLAPHVAAMEAAIAEAAGPPYVAREVTFQLPEFIQIVLNAGDDHEPFGAAIGQSLPNWGPAAPRTVVMTNLYTDPASVADLEAGAAALLDGAGTPTLEGSQVGTILHEIVHNLGPSGREDLLGERAYFVEELKAQTGALYLAERLRADGAITDDVAAGVILDGVTWCFRKIAAGITDAYGALCSIQVGTWLDDGALTWTGDRFTLHPDVLTTSTATLMHTAAALSAQSDRAAVDALLAKYASPPPAIAERLRGFPESTFVYAID